MIKEGKRVKIQIILILFNAQFLVFPILKYLILVTG